MTDPDRDAILVSLAGPGLSFERAARIAPNGPGLYAVHASPATWHALGVGKPLDQRPLYVGKSESSLSGRDIDTHFSSGTTGRSTLRRSLAALLAQQLGLGAQPRNTAKPGHFANYGLPAADDAKLTSWMREQLRLSFWAAGGHADLTTIERRVIIRLAPPLNLTHVVTPWTATVKAARAEMAEQARKWRPSRGRGPAKEPSAHVRRLPIVVVRSSQCR